jgi:UrcA family protein
MAKIINIALAAAVLATGLAVPAMAGDTEKVSVEVRYDDLNLTSASGRERLETRVRSAVRRICRVGVSKNLELIRAAQTCATQAMVDADTKMASLIESKGVAYAERAERVTASAR